MHRERLGSLPAHEQDVPHGRRADLLALGPDDGFVIVEVKSYERDFLSDAKWPEYRAFCDRLYFAVDPAFPHAMLPQETGLLVADAYGGAVLREAPAHPLAPARRRALLLRFARLAARRLEGVLDPAGAGIGPAEG